MPSILEVSRKKTPFKKTPHRSWNFTETHQKNVENNSDRQAKPSEEVKHIKTKENDSQSLADKSKEKILSASPIEEELSPTIDKLETVPVSKSSLPREQGVSNSLAGREQGVSNPLAAREQLVSNSLASQKQDVSSSLAGHEQDVSAALSPREQDVSSPVSNTSSKADYFPSNPPTGKELDLLNYLCKVCMTECSLITPPITTKTLNSYLSVTSTRLRNIIARSIKKDYFKVLKQNCSSTGAFRIFKLEKNLYENLVTKINNIQSHSPLATPLAEPYIVSSSNIYNTNTTNNHENDLPEDWNIDFSELSEIGFRESHLRKIYEASKVVSKIKASRVRESIFALAHDLKDEKTKARFISQYSKMGLVNVFVKTLKQGEDWVATFDTGNFKLPEEKALEDRLQMLKERQSKIAKMHDEVFHAEYDKWLNELPENELLDFVPEQDVQNMPEKLRKTARIKKAKTLTEDYFRVEIWPAIREEIFSNENRD